MPALGGVVYARTFMRPTLARLGVCAPQRCARPGTPRGISFPSAIVASITVLVLLAAVATPVQAGVDLPTASGGGALSVMAAQLASPPGTIEVILEVALVLGIIAVFLM